MGSIAGTASITGTLSTQELNTTRSQTALLGTAAQMTDLAKGLRSLAAFDANGDGRIDALDPVYAKLKVWQDLDQDCNNTHNLQLGPFTEVAQNETGGVKELRSLADWGITAIDYSNSRYEFASVSGNNGSGYGSISSQTLEAKDEGNHLGNLALTDIAERCYQFNRSLRMFGGSCRVNTYVKTCANQSDWRQVA